MDTVLNPELVVEFRFQSAGVGQNSVGTRVKNTLAVIPLRSTPARLQHWPPPARVTS